MIHRRRFLGLIGAVIAAPAIVRASSLMPVKALALPPALGSDSTIWRVSYLDDLGDAQTIIRQGGIVRASYRYVVNQPLPAIDWRQNLPEWARPSA